MDKSLLRFVGKLIDTIPRLLARMRNSPTAVLAYPDKIIRLINSVKTELSVFYRPSEKRQHTYALYQASGFPQSHHSPFESARLSFLLAFHYLHNPKQK